MKEDGKMSAVQGERRGEVEDVPLLESQCWTK